MICLPVSEYLHHNQLFRSIFLETLVSSPSNDTTPLPNTLLSLSSYILTHASSSGAPRCLAYANLSLNVLLVCVEHADIIRKFTQNEGKDVRLCRQVGLSDCVLLFHSYRRHLERDNLSCPYLRLHDHRFVHSWTAVFYGYDTTCKRNYRWSNICKL